MPNSEHYYLMAMEQLQQDIKDDNWGAIFDLLQQLPDDILIDYATFEEPYYTNG